MLPKTRLGKRSPLGALLSGPVPDGPPDPGDQEAGIATATGPGPQVAGRPKLHPGQKVYFQCGGGESSCRLHPVSSCIDVPRSHRSPDEVDMDEMMAAMVLTSLSCSPLLHRETAAPGMECGGGELSDSGSSGYWSVGCSNGSPAPSPPITEPDVGLATPPDEGLDMELEQVLFDEPAPRKRRNSVKAVFSCLWPGCGKVLSSAVGIKRHIRLTHLGQSGEERCCRSEEDFYYTEVQRPPSPPPPLLSPAPLLSPGPASGPTPLADGTARPGPLSRSAPPSAGSFWQVQSEHSYQAPPPVQVVSAAASSSTSCRWTAPPTPPHSRQVLSCRVRSLSVGEQWLQEHNAAPPRWPARRIRGEAKKCRKVYGIEHREQWCTACRWKKACQRFID
uniref:zinc finger protein 395-like n=1 Tax=Centroberyx gerrardi TaxID=166262 RepID=UPI003AB063C0